MVLHVLVPMDNSKIADATLEFALSAFPSAAAAVLHVAGGPISYMGEAMSLAVADNRCGGHRPRRLRARQSDRRRRASDHHRG